MMSFLPPLKSMNMEQPGAPAGLPVKSHTRQGGRVVRVLNFESVGRGFESHSEHFMDLFHGSPEL